MADQPIESQEKKKITIYGMPLGFFTFLLAIVVASIGFNVVPSNMPGALCVLLVLGAVFMVIGDKIPIFNDYIGGGPIACFLVGAYLVYANWLSESSVKSINNFFDKFAFIDLFVSVLITGSILSINRTLLVRALKGYFPAIFGGIAVSFAFGAAIGMAFGKSPLDIIAMYALPIMGGGTGAGAIPLSEIYSNITGNSKDTFLAMALPILTIANIMCIIIGACLNKVGQIKPSWTGNGELVRKGNLDPAAETAPASSASLTDVGAGLALATSIYLLGRLFSKAILPSIFGVQIHGFAYMVLFMAVLNIIDVVPENVKAGSKRLMKFFTNQLMGLQMFAVGVAYGNLDELIAALSIENVIICFVITLGALLGSAIVGWLVGFYPIEAGISAGLCMANRGGSGDVAVLGAAKRMNLMSFAQISSRLGGGIILFIGSVVFSLFT